MAHQFEDDGSGVSCVHCLLPKGNGRHRVPGAERPTPAPMSLDAVPTVGLHDQSTSHAAAAKAIARYGTVRRDVLSRIARAPADRGATDDELELLTGRTHQSLSACRNNLVRDGLAEPATDAAGEPVKRPTRQGNDAMAWRITPAGVAALRAADRVSV